MAYNNDTGGNGRGVDFDTAAKTALEEISVIVKHMGLDCECSFRGREEDRLNFEITGKEANLLGQDGATLDALQYLAYVLVGKRMGERYSISLDADGYRERRNQELVAYATQVADQAVAGRQEAVLDPLRPHERRIVHLALRERTDVETYSEGDEPFRRLVISPKNQS